MSNANKLITCRDCKMDFVFTIGEQEFYAEKGFANEPIRCASCREQRKTGRNVGGQYATRAALMTYSSYGGAFSGHTAFGGAEG